MGELSGKVALVTGSARNIGRAIALALAADGARVVVNARSSRDEAEETARLIREAGGEAMVLLADVTDQPAIEAMVAAIRERFGGIDILVNNAAVRREAPFLEMSLDEWRSITAAILDGAFICTRACLPFMGPGGRVISLGGISAHTGATRRAHVITAKAGIVGLTRALAREFIGSGITFNCVVPGHTQTTRPASFVPLYEKHEGGGAASAEPEDIAATIRFLCSPGARHVNGQTIHVNGGFLMP